MTATAATAYPHPHEAAKAVGMPPPELALLVLREVQAGRNWNQARWIVAKNDARLVGEVGAVLDGLLDDSCGTAGCVAGLAVGLALQAGADLDPDDTIPYSAGLLLGLDEHGAVYLFHPERTLGEVEEALERIAAGKPAR